MFQNGNKCESRVRKTLRSLRLRVKLLLRFIEDVQFLSEIFHAEAQRTQRNIS